MRVQQFGLSSSLALTSSEALTGGRAWEDGTGTPSSPACSPLRSLGHIFFPRYSGSHRYRVKDSPKEVSDACRFFVSQKTKNGLKETITWRISA